MNLAKLAMNGEALMVQALIGEAINASGFEEFHATAEQALVRADSNTVRHCLAQAIKAR